MEESIIYVDIDATEGENDGSSWENAYTDLQSALAVAGASDQIWVAEGTYLPTTTIDRTVSFVINNGVKVYGGFTGDETLLAQRNFKANETILSGNIGGDTQADNSYHVVDISGSPASTIIDGFTVSSGQADGDGGFARQDDGGGFFARSDASAVLSNLVVENNFASANGGGIYLELENSPTITNVIFRNNSASTSGGAIHLDTDNNLTVFNSLFVDNQSQGGGAIQVNNRNPNLNIANNTFYNNVGGVANAIYDESGSGNSTNIINNILWDDEAFGNPQVVLERVFIGTSNETTNFSNNIIKDNLPELERGEIIIEGNIIEDPLFVDPENNDFRLQLNSLGIDAGINTVVNGEEDIENNPRIYNETVDLGAIEYGLYFNINDVTVTEGDEGTTEAEFAITLLDTLDQPATEQISVDYATSDGRANAGEDFESISGTLIFALGDTELNTIVPVTGDTLPETNETFFVSLSEATGNAVIQDSQGVGLIANDDINQAGGTVFRLLNPDVGVHFYTTDVDERDEFIASGNYESEGASFTSVNPSVETSEEVFRFFNETTGVHLYTTDENERDVIRDNLTEFAFEGAVFNAYETQVEGSIPVYRFFNEFLGVHFYTPNAAERDFVEENLSNYESEGIAYYALPLDE